LGNGFFRTISSNDEGVLIPEWVRNHPNAKAVPVSIIGEGSKMPIAYIWAVDGDENLNLALVKKGVFPGSVMLDAVHSDILSKGSRDRANIEAGAAYARKLNPNLPEAKESPPRRLIQNSSYESFLKDLAKAQDIAREQKNGIWSDKFKALRDE
jgi:endonuclease YncB( thermonuclease family)